MGPIGALLAGVLAQHIGAPATVAAGGVACIGGALVFGMHLPALRVVGRHLFIVQEAAGDPAGGASGAAVAATH
jgi:hypothetical protein